MKKGKWSDDEDKFILENYNKSSPKIIAEKLDRKIETVLARAHKLKCTKVIKKWTEEEIKKLTELYETHDYKEIAKILNRGRDSIRQQLSKLGLKKCFPYHKITKEYLLEEYLKNKKRTEEIAKENNITQSSVHTALKKSDIKADRRIRKNGKHAHNWHGYEEIGQSYWSAVSKSAKERNIEFNITIEYVWDLFLKQNRKCALTGELLIFSPRSTKYYKDMTASLDRKNSSNGYVEGNVQWIHKKINHMKWTNTNEEFISWCRKVTDYNK